MADMHTPLWAVSIQGPDDLIPVADYLTAVRLANAFNEWWLRLKTEKPIHEYDPRMWAIPIEWAYADSEHEVDETGEYAGFFEAISGPAPSQDAETIKALREALTKQRAWVQHWLEDVRSNLKPTQSSLERQLERLSASLSASQKEPSHV